VFKVQEIDGKNEQVRKLTLTRCVKFGVKCDGYLIPPKRRNQQACATQCIRPIHPRVAPDFQPILWEPSHSLFRNEKDYRYFLHFCDKTALQLNGIIPTDLWSRLMLQACERNESVRHGIVAIAALDLTSQLTHESTSDPGIHYQFALQQYGLAIKHMQGEMSKGAPDLAITLITCLVIVCFETFHGNNYSASSQILTGLRMIEENIKGNIDQSLVEGFSSSILHCVDEELVRAFVRLYIQAMWFATSRTAAGNAFMRNFSLVNLSAMPTTFRNINEARHYFDLIMVVHFIDSKFVLQNRHLPSTEPNLHTPYPEDRKLPIIEGKAGYLSVLNQWHDAFEPMLRHAHTPGGKKYFLPTTILKFQYLAGRLSVENNMPDEGMTSWPSLMDFIPHFKEIVSLGRQIVEHPGMKTNSRLFTLDAQVIMPLYAVGWKCPHSATRREAITLLYKTPRREGLWDGVMAGKIARWILEVEEEHVVDGYMQQDMRMGQICLDFDAMTRILHVSGVMPKKGLEEAVVVKADLTW
jgi:Fungal specific transcription factor domain